LVVLLAGAAGGFAAEPGASPYARWSRGPSPKADFFPIAVWLQSPANAQRYREAGINLYVGLWRGPTDEQLQQLREAGMRVICSQNKAGLERQNDPTIVAWMHGDEPDNAQALPGGKGWGPPILPAKIVESYERLRAADPNRPVLLNLGQGVAWDGWHGRGVRTNHPEDYAEYVQGCDIASFDIYPAAHDNPQVAGNLWYVARGVERLKQWAGNRPVWNCIECSRIQNKKQHKATPAQVRGEVWMSLIHGSTGLIYFVHEWQPKFDEAALLHDPEMLAAVTQINHQIAELAPVLNSPTVAGAVQVRSSNNAQVPLATMVKRHEGALYLFVVGMRAGQTRARFTLAGLSGSNKVTVLGEQRTLEAKDGGFEDEFEPWGVHLYRVTTAD